MRRDEIRTPLEDLERANQRAIALVGRRAEAIVGRHLPRNLPDALGGIELLRVGGQAVQLDLVAVLPKPRLPSVVEPVAGAVVDDEEDLPRGVLRDELLQELVEGLAVEHCRKAVGELGVVERHRAEDVRGLAKAIGVNPRLVADARPRLVQCAIEPEAGLVLENHDAAAGAGFFLMAGSFLRSQRAWASASARASRLRGRCTEKPIQPSRRGM